MGLGEETLAITKECIRLLSEISLSIESQKNVTAPGVGKVTIYMELVELKNTVDTLRTTLVKLQSSNTRPVPTCVLVTVTKQAAEAMHNIIMIERATSADLWTEILLKLCSIDFVLAFQCHQLQEVNSEQFSRPSDLLCTTSSKEFWEQCFDSRWFVSWSELWERIMQRGWAEASEERAAKHFLDICCDDVVSSYELCLFIKWFGPMELAFRNLILTLKSGLLIGAISANESNHLLKGKLYGSFLIRFSKTRPGCFAVTLGGDTATPRHFLLNYVEPGKFSMQHSATVYTSIHNFVQMQPPLKYPVVTRTVCDLTADVPLLRSSVDIQTPHHQNHQAPLSLPPPSIGELSRSRSSPINSLSASLHVPPPGVVAPPNRPVYDDGLRPGARTRLSRANSSNTLNAPSNGSLRPESNQITTTVAVPPLPSTNNAPQAAFKVMATPSSSASPSTTFGFAPTTSTFAPQAFPSALTAPSTSGAPKGFGPVRAPVASPAITIAPLNAITISMMPSTSPSAIQASPGSDSGSPAPFGFAPVHRPATNITAPVPTCSSPVNSIVLPPLSSSPGTVARTAVLGFGPSQTASLPPMHTTFAPEAPATQIPFGQPPMGGIIPPLSTSPKPPLGFGPPSAVLNRPSSGFGPVAGFGPVGFGSVHHATSAPLSSHPAAQPMRTVSSPAPNVQASISSASSAHHGPQKSIAPISFGAVAHSQLDSKANAAFFPAPTVVETQENNAEDLYNSSDETHALTASVSLTTATTSSTTSIRTNTGTNSAGGAGTGTGMQNSRAETSCATSADIDTSSGWDDVVDGLAYHKNAPLDICVICLDHERSTLFLECSHMLCCAECSKLVSLCPICRQFITRVVPVYRS